MSIIDWIGALFAELEVWLLTSPDVTEFGLNVLTLGTVMTIFFSYAGAIVALGQLRNVVFRGRESVSIVWTMMFVWMYFVTAVYGWETQSPALAFQAGPCRTPIYAILIVALWFRGGFKWWQWLWFAFVTIVAWASLTYLSVEEAFLLFVLSGSLVAFHQAWKIWDNKARGDVHLWLIAIYWGSAFSWGIYGAAVPNWAIFGFSVPYFLVYSLTLWLWWKYPNPPKAEGELATA